MIPLAAGGDSLKEAQWGPIQVREVGGSGRTPEWCEKRHCQNSNRFRTKLQESRATATPDSTQVDAGGQGRGHPLSTRARRRVEEETYVLLRAC